MNGRKVGRLMKAAIFYGVNDIRVEKKELRKLKADEVLIQIKAAGICGTDVHIYQGKKGATEVNPPVILGHEFAGIVVDIGEDVETVKRGDYVTADPNFMCGKCDDCREGKPHFCENMQATGVNYDGGFAEYCIVMEKQVFTFPKTISFEAAAMCEPVGCCIHGIDLVGIEMNDTIMIIGGGTIGLIMLQLAKLNGAGKVVVIEPVIEKRELAAVLGADLAIDPMNSDIRKILAANNINKIDATIECCGAKATMESAVEYVDKGGTVMLFGLSDPDMQLSITPFEMFRKEISITSSFVNPNTHGRAVELISEGKLDIKALISERISLEELGTYLAVPSKKGKVLVCP